MAHPTDKCLSGLVLMASFLIQLITMGITYSVGVFNLEWMEAFDQTAASVSWIGAINIGVIFGLAPIPGFLASRYTHRTVVMTSSLLATTGHVLSAFATNVYTLYVTFGIISGAGICGAYSLGAVVCGYYFQKRRSMAIVFSFMGIGFGYMLFPLLFRALIKHYSWRGAMLLTGGVTLQICLLGAVFIPVDSMKSHKHGAVFGKELLILLKDYRTYCWFVSAFMWTGATGIYFLYILDYANRLLQSKDLATEIMSYSSIGSVVSRVLMSLVFALRPTISGSLVFAISCALTGVGMLAIPACKAYGSLLPVCTLIYFFLGNVNSTLVVGAEQTFGMDLVTEAYTLFLFGCGVAGLLGPPFAGEISEAANDDVLLFYIAACMMIIACACVMLFVLVKVIHRRKYENVANVLNVLKEVPT